MRSAHLPLDAGGRYRGISLNNTHVHQLYQYLDADIELGLSRPRSKRCSQSSRAEGLVRLEGDVRDLQRVAMVHADRIHVRTLEDEFARPRGRPPGSD